MPTSKDKLSQGQALHAGLLVLLSAAVFALPLGDARAWVAAGMAAAVGHQLWVLLWWRLEYYRGLASRTFGEKAFSIYAAGFATFSLLRIAAVIATAIFDGGSLPIEAALRWPLAAVLLAPSLWLLHSVANYFGFDHAMGADHFFESHRSRGLCRDGIFRYVPNAMYTVGFLSLWAPGVAFESYAAIVLAAFNHAYIWVHYFCTERPDMRRIYG